jgi:hypothetical protein
MRRDTLRVTKTTSKAAASMNTFIETVKKYKAEIVLVGMYIYVIILGIATLKELGII